MPQATDPTVVAAAAHATHEILNHVGDAIGRLNHAFEGHVVDAHGVLSDIGQSRKAIELSQHNLSAALAILVSPRWPDRGDSR